MDLRAKRVVLTGAAGGIGRALAHSLDKAGAELILVGRNYDSLCVLREELGEQHTVVCADVTTAEGRRDLLQTCMARDLGIQGLINNAGVSEFSALEEQTGIEQMLATNLTAPILICQMLLPLLKQQQKACILNVGSCFGSIGYPGYSGYCASKFGLRGFSEALRRELSASSVAVIYVAPRATKTASNDERVNRLNAELGNTVDDVARVARHITEAMIRGSDREVYIGWPEKYFVKMNAVLPGLVDRSLAKQLPVIESYSRAN